MGATMDHLGVAALLLLLAGAILAAAGFLLAGNLGLGPVLASPATVRSEAGLAQSATRSRVLGAWLRLAGLLLMAIAAILLGVALGRAEPTPEGTGLPALASASP